MKGRALLHHDAQLDDRATLDSIPGVKNGTILKVDKCVSQLKKKSTGKKTVMSGPASSEVDEDVMESIEESGDDDEKSSEDEGRISSSKRKRSSREAVIDDDSIANSIRGESLLPGDTSDDPLNMTDTRPSNTALALRIPKKEKRDSIARQQAISPEAPNLGHELHFLGNHIVPPQGPPTRDATASTHMPKITAAISSHQNLVEDGDAAFLAGINAAAGGTERQPLHSKASPAQNLSSRQCNTCGRACGCVRVLSTRPLGVVPTNQRTRGQENAYTDGNTNGHLVAKRISTSQRAESSWTGM